MQCLPSWLWSFRLNYFSRLYSSKSIYLNNILQLLWFKIKWKMGSLYYLNKCIFECLNRIRLTHSVKETIRYFVLLLHKTSNKMCIIDWKQKGTHLNPNTRLSIVNRAHSNSFALYHRIVPALLLHGRVLYCWPTGKPKTIVTPPSKKKKTRYQYAK